MNIYTIFDDFPSAAQEMLKAAGNTIVIHPLGQPRPSELEMKSILEEYDCVIIGTSQKIKEDMFDNIETPKIIATASVGVDHIKIPDSKKNLVTIINTPKANAKAVAEYTIGMMLLCCKRINEGCQLYSEGKNNKFLSAKPRELSSMTLGVVGAGNIARKIIEYASVFGMKILCWTRNPEKHKDLTDNGVTFMELDELVSKSDIISVNLPDTMETKNIISSALVDRMKNDAIFISISRKVTIDLDYLFDKALNNKQFYLCVDVDVFEDVAEKYNMEDNIYITPHIAGGTVETRMRMFTEVAEQICGGKKEN